MVNATRQVARDQRDSSAVTESEQDVIRSLGSLEHLFWLLDQHHFVHFAVTALISGETSPCDWRRALDRLQKRHPILSVCIAGEPDSAPLFRQAGAAPIPLRILEEEPELRWEAEVEKELATPFNPSRAPLIRAVLIQGARDAAFMLVAHHSIADGLSLAYAIRDTLDALAGRSLLPLPWLSSQDDMMNVSDSLMDGQEQDQAGAAMPAIYRPHDNARPTVKALRLSPGLTSSVRNRARQEGTTVHGALCAALVLASREVFAAWREIPLRILSPINARPLLGADESCGVFLGATTSVFDKQAIDFWDIARDARIDVAANKTTEKIAAQLSEFRRVVGNGADVATVAEFVAKVFASEILLTNLGSLSFDRQFGPVTLKAMFGPAVLTGFEGHQTIGIATVNGALCLLHTSHTPPQGLLEKTQSVLAQAIGRRPRLRLVLDRAVRAGPRHRADDLPSAANCGSGVGIGGSTSTPKDEVMTIVPTQASPATQVAHANAPISDLDPYSDEALMEPWAMYRELQGLGSAAWLTRYQMFALTRYDSVIRALKDASAFSSASGVMMNDDMNEVLRGNTLCSDGADHQRLRRVIGKPLGPTALKSLQEEIASKAEQLVGRLVSKGTFCAITELATFLPMDIVATAVGLPQDGRERMLVWAAQMFNCFGPLNDRARGAFPVLEEMMHYASSQAVRGKLRPGSWADAILDAVDRGEVDQAVCPVMMIDYVGPSLDTTIYAIGSGVWLFAKHPEEWRKVRESPSRIPAAINEIVRMEAPIQSFSRLLTRNYDMGEITLPAGSRAIAFYGAANRDERKFPDPHRFDVTRGSAEHMAFGWGPHMCVGQHLARLEMNAIFCALAARVERFHIQQATRNLNNVLRGFSKLMVSVE